MVAQLIVIALGSLAIFTWAAWPTIVIWWYRPMCCRRYTSWVIDPKPFDDTDSYYQCMKCGSICDYEDAVRLRR